MSSPSRPPSPPPERSPDLTPPPAPLWTTKPRGNNSLHSSAAIAPGTDVLVEQPLLWTSPQLFEKDPKKSAMEEEVLRKFNELSPEDKVSYLALPPTPTKSRRPAWLVRCYSGDPDTVKIISIFNQNAIRSEDSNFPQHSFWAVYTNASVDGVTFDEIHTRFRHRWWSECICQRCKKLNASNDEKEQSDQRRRRINEAFWRYHADWWHGRASPQFAVSEMLALVRAGGLLDLESLGGKWKYIHRAIQVAASHVDNLGAACFDADHGTSAPWIVRLEMDRWANLPMSHPQWGERAFYPFDFPGRSFPDGLRQEDGGEGEVLFGQQFCMEVDARISEELNSLDGELAPKRGALDMAARGVWIFEDRKFKHVKTQDGLVFAFVNQRDKEGESTEKPKKKKNKKKSKKGGGATSGDTAGWGTEGSSTPTNSITLHHEALLRNESSTPPRDPALIPLPSSEDEFEDAHPTPPPLSKSSPVLSSPAASSPSFDLREDGERGDRGEVALEEAVQPPSHPSSAHSASVLELTTEEDTTEEYFADMENFEDEDGSPVFSTARAEGSFPTRHVVGPASEHTASPTRSDYFDILSAHSSPTKGALYDDQIDAVLPASSSAAQPTTPSTITLRLPRSKDSAPSSSQDHLQNAPLNTDPEGSLSSLSEASANESAVRPDSPTTRRSLPSTPAGTHLGVKIPSAAVLSLEASLHPYGESGWRKAPTQPEQEKTLRQSQEEAEIEFISLSETSTPTLSPEQQKRSASSTPPEPNTPALNDSFKGNKDTSDTPSSNFSSFPELQAAGPSTTSTASPLPWRRRARDVLQDQPAERPPSAPHPPLGRTQSAPMVKDGWISPSPIPSLPPMPLPGLGLSELLRPQPAGLLRPPGFFSPHGHELPGMPIPFEEVNNQKKWATAGLALHVAGSAPSAPIQILRQVAPQTRHVNGPPQPIPSHSPATGPSQLPYQILELIRRSLDDLSVEERTNVEQDLVRLAAYPNHLPLSSLWKLLYRKSGPNRSQYSLSASYVEILHAYDVPTLCGRLKALYNRNPRVLGSLKPGCSLSFFRAGIKPEWEDVANAKGGRITFNPPGDRKDEMFGRLLLLVAGNSIEARIQEHPDYSSNARNGHITGIVGACRRNDFSSHRIEIWVANRVPDLSVGSEWIACLKDILAVELSLSPEAIPYKKHLSR
ncbi:hypothetical protein MNV49_004204 [Pseudohyphozyma bogoriensis]|nr:hypothetical protein MNV49_004204 [Pseudohyphozyma bogoriensis]